MKTTKQDLSKFFKELLVAVLFMSPGGRDDSWREIGAFIGVFISSLVAVTAFTQLMNGGSGFWILLLIVGVIMPVALLVKAFKYIFRFANYKKS